MKTPVLGIAFAALLVASAASAQTTPFTVGKCAADAVTFSNIRLPQPVLADGKPLAAGTYQIRIATQHPTPAVGQSPTAECWVEFVKDGAVAGREVASVISAEDITSIAKGPAPKLDQSRVDVLKGGDYVRIWINSAGTNYLINMPVAR
jgi:hypothetical protein